MENYYNTLGIAPNASEDEIKVSIALAMRFHPDRNQAPGADARFKSVTKAYEILSDPAKREEYNQSEPPHHHRRGAANLSAVSFGTVFR
jgi:molecular chaperone DnaJ